MTPKIGDKVRYLNSVGGGIVKRFQGKNVVLVEEPDGFETPALITECVVVDDNPMQVRQPEAVQNTTLPPPQQPAPEPEKIEELPGGDILNAALVFLPNDVKKMPECGYETYFVNDSNYFLFFNYMSGENNGWRSRYNGLIEPNTKLFIEAFGKEQINELEKACVQIIAFKKDKMYAMKNALSVELRIDTVKFYKLHCFTDNDYFDEPALVYPLVENDRIKRSMYIDSDRLREAILSKELPHESRQPAKKNQLPEAPVEVDLHINSLLETTAGMSNSDLLNHQLGVVRKTLEAHKNEKGRKIVFIHGKGEGVLRKALLDELKQRYGKYTVQDASFREYGFGATQVTVR